jgi:oligopeptide/dipeptide ABC transporter ATP-binding protein
MRPTTQGDETGAVALELRGVSTSLLVGSRLRPAVLDVDMLIRAGEIVGLVGESGSGKSMTARTIAGALPAGAVATGSVLLDGEDLLTMTRRRRRVVQKAIGMIFQDPRAFIDPLWRVEDHLTEGLRVHLGMSRSEARTRAIELLDTVGIDQPERRIHQYPGEMSGGMLQRVMIAGALSVEPSVLLADEATTALDVTTQAAIVELLERIRTERGLAVLFITHDLALANSICDRVCVMYAGRLVEVREGRQIFDDPRHPYTMGLLAARPSVGARVSRLPVIEGTPTSAMEAPDGCSFHPRCPYVLDKCRQALPGLVAVPGGVARCVRAGEGLSSLRATALAAAPGHGPTPVIEEGT